MAGLEHQGFNALQGLGRLGGEELVLHLGHGLAALPAVEFFGPPIPIGDAAPKIPDQDGVMGQVQEFGLAFEHLPGPPALGDVLLHGDVKFFLAQG